MLARFVVSPLGMVVGMAGRLFSLTNGDGTIVAYIDPTQVIALQLTRESKGAAGACKVFAGILYSGATGAADPGSGLTFLLPGFAAVFFGSTSIVPGRFNPWGSTIAVYFLAFGISGVTIQGVQTYVQNLFYGGALVIAVSLSQLVRRHRT